ncbi:MAG: glucosaminidase domain-containing protein [Steroidobacteraceae bacterium]
MSIEAINPGYYADFGGLERLKGAAHADDPAAVRAAARQFESLFTRMMLKTMREASLADGMGDSEQTRFYQDMYDQQLSVVLSQGRGLGLADLLVEQLARTGLARPAEGTATPAAAAAPGANAMPATATATPAQQAEFVRAMTPLAEAAGRRLGVAPETVIAHAALESGWGRHVPATAGRSSFNLFGIKAQHGWNGAAVAAATTEFDAAGPRRVAAAFRGYDSAAAGVADYTGLLAGNPRYAGALDTGADTHAFASALQRGGYATDPDYVRKLVATAATVRELQARQDLKSTAAMPTTRAEGPA